MQSPDIPGLGQPKRRTPIMIQNPRPGTTSGYWDDPINLIKPKQAELLFIAYFDWNQMDYIDLRYYRVKIVCFDAHPELVGREALIERQHATVHLTNEIGFARGQNGRNSP
jgi:hypothetical protein